MATVKIACGPGSLFVFLGRVILIHLEVQLLFVLINSDLFLSLSITVVVTTLTQAGFRRLEGVGRVTVCVIKDLETASQVNVTLRTINGTAQRTFVCLCMHSFCFMES